MMRLLRFGGALVALTAAMMGTALVAAVLLGFEAPWGDRFRAAIPGGSLGPAWADAAGHLAGFVVVALLSLRTRYRVRHVLWFLAPVIWPIMGLQVLWAASAGASRGEPIITMGNSPLTSLPSEPPVVP